ncbi:hypothetical protein GGP41_003912 [Bipolaris sorokiniana]|uniref:Uncharacterized protein n=1 Tax=Cochliobolus sativus TaxID=45130 RepID=A0A8H6DRW7_COCSA|nr:hypothetical protein GGP41_003912 [Bipolaris sorokiniana]
MDGAAAMREESGFTIPEFLILENLAISLARKLISCGGAYFWSAYEKDTRIDSFKILQEAFYSSVRKKFRQCVFDYGMVMAFYRIRKEGREKKTAKKKRHNTKDADRTMPAVEGCIKSLNLPPSMMLTSQQHVSTFQSTKFENTMESSSSESTMDFDQPGHEHTTIPTSTPRTLRSATKNKEAALTYQSLPQLAEQFGKDSGLTDAELGPLSNTVDYQANQLMEKRSGIPWKDYTYKEKDCCLESTQTMIRVMTKKTVPRASLESMISWLIDTRIHAQGEKVKEKKAAAIYIDKKDADKSHAKVRRFDPIRDI